MSFRVPGPLVSVSWLATHRAQKQIVVLDARSAARFHGRAPEPRTGLRAGHMPNATVCRTCHTATKNYCKLRVRRNGLHSCVGGGIGGLYRYCRVRWFLV